ncbi:Alkaline phosphatase synthesis transcriptional regulatory protein PhoP [subsurface metagenome]
MQKLANILIVDDDPDVREAVKIILETQPYELIFASNGEECLEQVKKNTPDLIILDLLMPKKDGFEVIKELRGHPSYPRIPILVLTAVKKEAAGRRYELETALRMDVDDYIEKPIQPDDLIDRVKRILTRARRK